MYEKVNVKVKGSNRGLNDLAGAVVFLGAVALKVSGVPVDTWDQVAIFLVLLTAFIKWI
jgi:hypothetical protein